MPRTRTVRNGKLEEVITETDNISLREVKRRLERFRGKKKELVAERARLQTVIMELTAEIVEWKGYKDTLEP